MNYETKLGYNELLDYVKMSTNQTDDFTDSLCSAISYALKMNWLK